MTYDQNYYQGNAQDRDRPALWLYERLWLHYCGRGPVLEFGCGVGFMAKRLSEHEATYALEINPYALDRVRINAPGAIPMSSLDALQPGSIGSIVSLHVLEHIPDDELRRLGKRFKELLEPGGRMLLVMPNRLGKAHRLMGDQWLAFADPTHINLKSSSEWRELFTNEWQLTTIAVHADGYYAFPYGRGIAGHIGDLFRAARTAIQFILGRFILKPDDGEAVIFVLQKEADSTVAR